MNHLMPSYHMLTPQFYHCCNCCKLRYRPERSRYFALADSGEDPSPFSDNGNGGGCGDCQAEIDISVSKLLGFETFANFLRVYVSVSENLVPEKKFQFRARASAGPGLAKTSTNLSSSRSDASDESHFPSTVHKLFHLKGGVSQR